MHLIVVFSYMHLKTCFTVTSFQSSVTGLGMFLLPQNILKFLKVGSKRIGPIHHIEQGEDQRKQNHWPVINFNPDFRLATLGQPICWVIKHWHCSTLSPIHVVFVQLRLVATALHPALNSYWESVIVQVFRSLMVGVHQNVIIDVIVEVETLLQMAVADVGISSGSEYTRDGVSID